MSTEKLTLSPSEQARLNELLNEEEEEKEGGREKRRPTEQELEEGKELDLYTLSDAEWERLRSTLKTSNIEPSTAELLSYGWETGVGGLTADIGETLSDLLANSADENREERLKEREERLHKLYPHIQGTKWANSTAVGMGHLGSAILTDPLSFTPIGLGKTVLQGAGIGAGIGSAASVFADLSETGEVSGKNLILSTGLGAGLGSLGGLLGRKIQGDAKQLIDDIIDDPHNIEKILSKNISGTPQALNKSFDNAIDHFVESSPEIADILVPLRQTIGKIRTTQDNLSSFSAKGLESVKKNIDKDIKDIQNRLLELDVSKHAVLKSALGKKMDPLLAFDKKLGRYTIRDLPISQRMGDDTLNWFYGGSKLNASVDELIYPDAAVPRLLSGIAKSPFGRWVMRPETQLATITGDTKFANRFGKVVNQYRRRTSQEISRIEKMTKNFTPEEIQNWAEVMSGVSKVPMSRAVNKAVAYSRNLYRSKVRDAVKMGVLSGEKGARILKNQNYLPHIYDIEKLQSKEGRDAFMKMLSSEDNWVKPIQAGRKTQAEVEENLASIYASITGEGEQASKAWGKAQYERILRGQANTPEIMRKLFSKHGQNLNDSTRSTHLEFSRKLRVDEELLLPFLLKDPKAVLALSLEDINKRLFLGKEFNWKAFTKTKKSKSGQKMRGSYSDIDSMLIRLADEKGMEAYRKAEDIIFAQLGDPRSLTVSKAIAFYADNPALGKMLNSLNALQTHKLAMSAVINAGQGIVNGMTLIAKLSHNPITALSVGLRAILKSAFNYDKSLQFARESGSVFDSHILEMGVEAHRHSKIVDKTYKIPFINFLNDPQKFLRGVGFFKVEEWNRTLGASMSQIYVDDLARLAQQGKQKGIDGLRELGINSSEVLKRGGKLTTSNYEQAAYRFNEIINFSREPQKVPVAWGSPHGKLLTKFKMFVLHHTRFITQQVIEPAMKGNVAPAITYFGTVGLPAGWTIQNIREKLRGADKDKNKNELISYVETMGYVGGMGWISDLFWQASTRGEAGVMSWFAGPTISDGVDIVTSLPKGGIDALLKSLADATIPNIPGKRHIINEGVDTITGGRGGGG